MNDKDSVEYSIDDVITAKDDEVVEISFKDGVIPFKIEPIKHREFSLIQKQTDISGKGDTSEMLNKLITKCTYRKDDDGEWTPMDMETFNKLPFSVTNRLIGEVNKKLGLEASIEDMENL